MKLINQQGHTVNVGDIVHDFRGKAAIVTGWQAPRHSGSTGRVNIKEMDERGLSASYYPGVYDLAWEGQSED